MSNTKKREENDEFNSELNKNLRSNNNEIAILKEQIKKLNQKIDESHEKLENAEITKLKIVKSIL